MEIRHRSLMTATSPLYQNSRTFPSYLTETVPTDSVALLPIPHAPPPYAVTAPVPTARLFLLSAAEARVRAGSRSGLRTRSSHGAGALQGWEAWWVRASSSVHWGEAQHLGHRRSWPALGPIHFTPPHPHPQWGRRPDENWFLPRLGVVMVIMPTHNPDTETAEAGRIVASSRPAWAI